MKDPFSPPERREATNFLVVGAVCSVCSKTVCVDQVGSPTEAVRHTYEPQGCVRRYVHQPTVSQETCSLFYGSRFCRTCAVRGRGRFPAEIQKVRLFSFLF